MQTNFLKAGDPVAIQELVKRLFLEINTAIPGIVDSYNGSNQTASIKPAIRSINITVDGSVQTIDLPVLILVPVWFPYSRGSGFSLTYPVQKGDDALIVFSQRGIDNWLLHGNVQDPVGDFSPRALSMSDGIAFVGLVPNPAAIKSFQTDGIELRNAERTFFCKVSATAAELTSGSNHCRVTAATAELTSGSTSIVVSSGSIQFKH